MMTFDTAVAQILGARSAVELFGIGNQAKVYRELAKAVHPDQAPREHTDKATAAFARLSELWTSIKTITVKEYQVQAHFGHDALSDWFSAARSDGSLVMLKVGSNPRDNDLMRREAENLQKLSTGIDPNKSAFFPELLDSFPYRDIATDADRIINVFNTDVTWFSLRTIAHSFNGELDGPHIAWIWRRLLLAMGLAHEQGVIHGGLTPDNILINPELHGLRLVNWCYSAQGSQRIPAVMHKYLSWYHDDVLLKRIPTPASDIFLATKAIAQLCGAIRMPDSLNKVYRHSLEAKNVLHGNLAFNLLEELDRALETVYGPRTFTKFPDLPDSALIWPQG